MFVRENFRWLFFVNTFSMLGTWGLIIFLSPLNPRLLLPGVTVLVLTIGWPFVLRAIWPQLDRIPFLNPSMVLFIAITTPVALSVFVATLATHGSPWLLLLSVICLAGACSYVRYRWSTYNLWRRRLLHLCPACGYDLRASLERCPECGMPIPEDYRFYFTRDPASLSPERTATAAQRAAGNSFYIPGQGPGQPIQGPTAEPAKSMPGKHEANDEG